MTTMKDLPIDISVDILKRLPMTSLVCSRAVSKAWRDLSSHPDLKELLKHPCVVLFSKKSPDRLHLIEGDYFHNKDRQGRFTSEINLPFLSRDSTIKCLLSCNGYLLLGCLRELDGLIAPEVYVCNPLRKSLLRLPQGHKFISGTKNSDTQYTYGFGFHPISREYKVVRIVSRGGRQLIYVFTFGLSHWRHVTSCPFIVADDMNGVLVNGTLNWVGYHSENEVSRQVIVSFDLHEEKFSSIPFPSPSGQNLWTLAVLGGRLSAYDGEMMIWSLEKNGGDWLWSEMFCVPHDELFDAAPLFCLPNGKIFVMDVDATCLSYDREGDLLSLHEWVNVKSASYVTTYYPSLV